ncbi:uncharacterized protein ACNS7B_016191 [Menidia menidia]
MASCLFALQRLRNTKPQPTDVHKSSDLFTELVIMGVCVRIMLVCFLVPHLLNIKDHQHSLFLGFSCQTTSLLLVQSPNLDKSSNVLSGDSELETPITNGLLSFCPPTTQKHQTSVNGRPQKFRPLYRTVPGFVVSNHIFAPLFSLTTWINQATGCLVTLNWKHPPPMASCLFALQRLRNTKPQPTDVHKSSDLFTELFLGFLCQTTSLLLAQSPNMDK